MYCFISKVKTEFAQNQSRDNGKTSVTSLNGINQFRSSHQRGSIKELFIRISHYSQEYLCWSLLFNKVAGLQELLL